MGTVVVNPPSRIPGPFPTGRKCCEDTCRTVLSTYNGTRRCWIHSGWDEIDLSVDFFRVMADADLRTRNDLADELAKLMEEV